jgi:hypothetical protein
MPYKFGVPDQKSALQLISFSEDDLVLKIDTSKGEVKHEVSIKRAMEAAIGSVSYACCDTLSCSVKGKVPDTIMEYKTIDGAIPTLVQSRISK